MERRSILNVGAGLRTAISTTCLCLFSGKPIALRSPTSSIIAVQRPVPTFLGYTPPRCSMILVVFPDGSCHAAVPRFPVALFL